MHLCDPTIGIDVRLSDPEMVRDPYPLYERLQRAAPLVRCHQPITGDGWMMTRYDDIQRVLKDARRFNNNPRATGKTPPFEGRFAPKILRTFSRSMISADGEDHRRLRGLVAQAFSAARVEALSDHIATIVDELLDDIEARAADREVDLMRALALPLPLRIIAELLGVDERERSHFHRLTQSIMNIGGTWDIIRHSPSLFQLYRFFDALLERKRAVPGDDLTSALIAAEDEGLRLDGEELVGTVFLLLFAGHETTVNLIGNGTLALLEHPEQFERLRQDPALVPAAIEEMLRFDSPAQFSAVRFVAEDCEVGGFPLRRGDKLMPCVAAANRDAEVFSNAEGFDIGRNPNRHLAFGLGPHFCIGAQLSRVEGRHAFAGLARRLPTLRLAVERDALRWRKNSSGLRGLEALPVRLH